MYAKPTLRQKLVSLVASKPEALHDGCPKIDGYSYEAIRREIDELERRNIFDVRYAPNPNEDSGSEVGYIRLTPTGLKYTA